MTTGVTAVSQSVRLNIHKGNTKVLKYITENTNSIMLDGETVEDVETFTYLQETFINEQGRSGVDVNARIGKARAAFLQLKKTWSSKQLSVNQYQSHNLQYERQYSQFYCMELKFGELPQASSTR
ncbi:unnamed protein product [Schistosoma margrebowiei]|uniref:Uncharacterized protein n=1 Tax=Schistosoma margrebowiei TaxID=48269 RepID=A0A183MZC3_9TREM|nr:unnamed protein product [Schistosoma margrebowiei]